jgi:hypothetical protein
MQFGTLNYLALSLLVLVNFGSCKSDSKVDKTATADTVIEKAPPKDEPAFTPSDLELPDACSVITKAEIAAALKLKSDEILIKDGSNPKAPHARACFFKWNGGIRANAGILIQIQKNPVGDEFPAWATSYVESKRTSGESSFTGEAENYKYKKWTDVGDDGSYSYDLGKCLGRIGDDYVYMIAFNEDMSEAAQMQAARTMYGNIMARIGK